MKPFSHLVSQAERETIFFAPDSLTAALVKQRLALLHLDREIHRQVHLPIFSKPHK